MRKCVSSKTDSLLDEVSFVLGGDVSLVQQIDLLLFDVVDSGAVLSDLLTRALAFLLVVTAFLLTSLIVSEHLIANHVFVGLEHFQLGLLDSFLGFLFSFLLCDDLEEGSSLKLCFSPDSVFFVLELPLSRDFQLLRLLDS